MWWRCGNKRTRDDTALAMVATMVRRIRCASLPNSMCVYVSMCARDCFNAYVDDVCVSARMHVCICVCVECVMVDGHSDDMSGWWIWRIAKVLHVSVVLNPWSTKTYTHTHTNALSRALRILAGVYAYIVLRSKRIPTKTSCSKWQFSHFQLRSMRDFYSNRVPSTLFFLPSSTFSIKE